MNKSTRDLAYPVPINFVTHPGVSVTAACFGNRTYSAIAAGKCISNLLAAQYRQLVLDIYWDASARQFSLCPCNSRTRQEPRQQSCQLLPCYHLPISLAFSLLGRQHIPRQVALGKQLQLPCMLPSMRLPIPRRHRHHRKSQWKL